MTTLMIEELEVFQQEMDQPVDFGEALQEAVTSVGDSYGLYELMLHHGPITSACLATQAGIPERLARLWLNVQADDNCLAHQRKTGLYALWCSWPLSRAQVS